jgi:excisionase family DNA binding protein
MDNGTRRLAYSVDEACEALGIGRVLMYDLINTGRIHSVKVGARRLIPASGTGGVSGAVPFTELWCEACAYEAASLLVTLSGSWKTSSTDQPIREQRPADSHPWSACRL